MHAHGPRPAFPRLLYIGLMPRLFVLWARSGARGAWTLIERAAPPDEASGDALCANVLLSPPTLVSCPTLTHSLPPLLPHTHRQAALAALGAAAAAAAARGAEREHHK